MYAVKLEIFRVDCSHGFRLVRHVTQRFLLIFTVGNTHKYIQFCSEFLFFSLWWFFIMMLFSRCILFCLQGQPQHVIVYNTL